MVSVSGKQFHALGLVYRLGLIYLATILTGLLGSNRNGIYSAQGSEWKECHYMHIPLLE